MWLLRNEKEVVYTKVQLHHFLNLGIIVQESGTSVDVIRYSIAQTESEFGGVWV